MAEPPIRKWPLLENVRRYARLFVPDEEAIDIATRAWERMYQHYPQQMDNFSLARVVTKRVALDSLRAEGRHHRHRVEETELSQDRPDARDDYASVDLWESLRTLLTQDELLVLTLAYQIEMTPAEIALATGRPLTTVYSIRARAVQKARLAFAEGR